MELTRPFSNSVMLSSKKGSILVDAQNLESDTKIVILNDNEEDKLTERNEEVLVIQGPGEYEAGGITVKGRKPNGKTYYEVDNDEARVIFLTSESLEKLPDEEDFHMVVVKADGELDEAKLSAISTSLVVVFGDEANVPESIKEKRVSKINLKKRDDIEGNLVFLDIK